MALRVVAAVGRRVDLHLLLALALVVPAVLPLRAPGHLGGFDAWAHLFRIRLVEEGLRQGIFFPRWAAEFLYGQGYPLFNHYAAFAYYVGVAYRLLGASFEAAVKLTYATGVLYAACGMYLLGRAIFGPRAGVLAAVAYVYAPYALHDIYTRAGLAEQTALDQIPMIVFLFFRLGGPWKDDPGEHRRRLTFALLAALALAALALTHNPTAVITSVLVVAFGAFVAAVRVWQRWSPRRRATLLLAAWGHRWPLVYSVAAGLLAILVSSFFVLPALLEHGYTYNGQLPGPDPVFLRQLIPVRQLLADWVTIERNVPFFAFTRVGTHQLAVATLGIGALFFLKGERRAWLAFFALAFLFGSSLITEHSRPLWERIPVVTLMSFPTRVLMAVDLAIAMLAGALAAAGGRRWQWSAVAVVAPALMLPSLWRLDGWMMEFGEAPVNSAYFAAWERGSAFVGTTVPIQFLPRWVEVDPSLAATRPDFVGTVSPPGAGRLPRLAVQRLGPTRIELVAEGDAPSRLLFRSFYFPGWRAYVDGEPEAIVPEAPLGHSALHLPAGRHRISLRFEDTLARRLGNALTGVGVAVVLAGVLLLVARRLPPRGRPVVTLVPAILVGGAVYWGLGSGARHAGYAMRPAEAEFGGRLRLVAWRVEQNEVAEFGRIKVLLVWQALRDLDVDLVEDLRLVDDSGRVVARKVKRPVYGSVRTSWWQKGEIVVDRQYLQLEGGLAPGSYELRVGLLDPAVDERLREASGAFDARLGAVVTTHGAPPSPAYDMDLVALGDLDGEVKLVGYRVAGGEASPLRTFRPGDDVVVTLFWEAQRDLEDHYFVFVHLLDSQGNLVAQDDSFPPDDLVYTDAWEAGVVIRDKYRFRIPKSAAGGLYYLVAGMYSEKDGGYRLSVVDEAGREVDNKVLLERVKVPIAPPPPPSQVVGARLGDLIELVGYDLSTAGGESGAVVNVRPGEELRLTLHWRTLAAVPEDYTVFVHLVGDEGVFVGQHDSQPREGAYPTSIWEPGETVSDDLVLRVEPEARPGVYRIKTGMYLLASGERLSVSSPFADAEGRLSLAEVRVHR